jgi:hypothetical protein
MDWVDEIRRLESLIANVAMMIKPHREFERRKALKSQGSPV